MTRAARLVLVMGLALAGTGAAACSMMAGYKVPTNLELAVKGERIVIAEVFADKRGGDSSFDGTVFAKPVATIKGAPVTDTVEIPGAVMDSDPRMVIESNPRELRRANPGAMIGGCVRYVFKRGMKLVLFLHRDEAGKLVPFRSSFSRDAEDVASLDSLWVKAVREYAAISVLSKGEQKAALKARSAALRAAGDPDSLALADDLDIEIKGRRLPAYD